MVFQGSGNIFCVGHYLLGIMHFNYRVGSCITDVAKEDVELGHYYTCAGIFAEVFPSSPKNVSLGV